MQNYLGMSCDAEQLSVHQITASTWTVALGCWLNSLIPGAQREKNHTLWSRVGITVGPCPRACPCSLPRVTYMKCHWLCTLLDRGGVALSGQDHKARPPRLNGVLDMKKSKS